MTVQTVVLECARRRSRKRSHNIDADGGEAGTQREGSEAASKDDDGERETVLFHLWDDQMCLAALFRKGDGLAIFWPWLVQSEVHDAPEGGGRVGLSQQHVVLPSKVGSGPGPHTERLPQVSEIWFVAPLGLFLVHHTPAWWVLQRF